MQVRYGMAAMACIHRNKIDAVPVTVAVGEVVTKVRARGANGLAVFQDTRVLPDNLFQA